MESRSKKGTLFEKKLLELKSLIKQLTAASCISEKTELLDAHPAVMEYVNSTQSVKMLFYRLKPEEVLTVKILLAIGQGPIFFDHITQLESKMNDLRSMLRKLWEVDQFYAFMGGLAGYYYFVLKLLADKQVGFVQKDQDVRFLHSPGVDISKDTEENHQFVYAGIENLPRIAVIFPVGGAGDRLNLCDEVSGEPLPAAYLPLRGFSLLEGLIRDLQAHEFLYWKLFSKQLTIPVAMMTSHEKNNDERIIHLCQENHYFGRPVESFRRFIQPLVPVITEEGNFSQSAPLVLKLKPGGHGVLWKLAVQEGVFEWFNSHGCKKVFIRQINNPVAATDAGILAFIGVGCKKNKIFGFASCDRLVNAAEGMIVLHEKKSSEGLQYSIINIEYTDFQAKGIQDVPEDVGSSFSAYPANTNILFADIEAIEALVKKVAVPGMLINMKNKVPYIDKDGVCKEVYGGRLESMMQNISDSIVDVFPNKLAQNDAEKMRCFVTYGERQKVISVTKNKYDPEKPLSETPEGCFYDQMSNCRNLFSTYCQMQIPAMFSESEFMQRGPSFIIYYHPALGPLYSIIAQKIRGGLLKEGSELILNITELDCTHLELDGSLCIHAKSLMGNSDENGLLLYSNQNGKCELKNVKVINRGIDRSVKNSYWKNTIARHEQLEIILHGNAEFSALDVCFKGNMRLEVPVGMRMEVTMKDGKLDFHLSQIDAPTWHWEYASTQSNILLKKVRPTYTIS